MIARRLQLTRFSLNANSKSELTSLTFQCLSLECLRISSCYVGEEFSIKLLEWHQWSLSWSGLGSRSKPFYSIAINIEKKNFFN